MLNVLGIASTSSLKEDANMEKIFMFPVKFRNLNLNSFVNPNLIYIFSVFKDSQSCVV
jgi:hypothetical protein